VLGCRRKHGRGAVGKTAVFGVRFSWIVRGDMGACACGCGEIIEAPGRNQKYIDRSHRERARSRKSVAIRVPTEWAAQLRVKLARQKAREAVVPRLVANGSPHPEAEAIRAAARWLERKLEEWG